MRLVPIMRASMLTWHSMHLIGKYPLHLVPTYINHTSILT